MASFIHGKVVLVRLLQSDTYKIALEVTGCQGMEWPFYASRIAEYGNLELLHAILTCGMPFQFLSEWRHEKRSQEFIYKVSMVETNLKVNGGYLVKSPETEYLDASEKSANAYYLGLIFAKLFSMKEFDTDYFVHTSLFTQICGAGSFSCAGRKEPAFVGYKWDSDSWSIWDVAGRREKAPKAMDDAYNRIYAIRSVNGKKPDYSIACMTYFDSASGELLGTIRNAKDGRKADILFDKEDFLRLYYRPVCELFDESLRRKPFDSVIDYIDGYLEIELELFGLDIDKSAKDEYLRKHRLKLGIPKEILRFFQYRLENDSAALSLTSIADSLHEDFLKEAGHHQASGANFFMGRDGIYLRMA